jgi:23S rRNA-/tRNA-specific pseudouridylate synthase
MRDVTKATSRSRYRYSRIAASTFASLIMVLLWDAILSGVDGLIISSNRQGEALARFNAWNKANQNRDTLQEFTVKEVPDDDRSSRLSHFAPTVFMDSLQTINAANLSCRSGRLTLNDEKVSGARRVKTGDKIAYLNDRSDRRTKVPANPNRADRFCNSRLRLLKTLSDEGMSHSPLRVLYEDDYMAIVCKPAGIHTMSWAGSFGKSLCLDEILPLLLEPPTNISNGNGDESSKSQNGMDINTDTDTDEPLSAPLPRHRLDNRVAGPVVVAKTRRALIQIGRFFEERKVKKEYRAIVVGEIQTQNNATSFIIDSEVDGRPSQTEVTVLGQTPCDVNGILTDVLLFPMTGRKHQLRVHCAEVLGTPILGDDLHSGKGKGKEGYDDVREDIPVRRKQGLYLYCQLVSLRHPITGEIVSAQIPEPFRFTRTRRKALKGFEWATTHSM